MVVVPLGQLHFDVVVDEVLAEDLLGQRVRLERIDSLEQRAGQSCGA